MRQETSGYQQERLKWVSQPVAILRPYYVRKAGDLTEYAFSRDLASGDVLSPTNTKLKVIRGMQGSAQQADPVAGRSSIGTLEVDLGDLSSTVLKQVSDPARPLSLHVRGSAGVRLSPQHATFGADAALHASALSDISVRMSPQHATFGADGLFTSAWSHVGLGAFQASKVNDGDRDAVAFDANTAASGSYLQLDAGDDRAFVSAVFYSAGTGANAAWTIGYSDDGSTFTTVATGFSTGGAKADALNWPRAGAHRFWRFTKTDAATVGPAYYEVQLSEFQQGDNVVLQVDDVRGYPDVGHVTLDAGSASEEDFSYTGLNTAVNAFTGVARAARGTAPADHAEATVVRNGEQLRRGARLALLLGYAPLPESQYGPSAGYTKMEIQSVKSLNYNLTWRLACSDIQRFTKLKIFEKASATNPAAIGPDHPLTIWLKVVLSTGTGSNGPYDVLTKDLGAAVPASLIAISVFEALRGTDGIAGTQMQFRETSPQDAKEWGETQILRPLGLLPVIDQAGRYSARVIASPFFARSAYATSIFRAA